MPQLLVFVPCEKVILGQGDNSASLIGIMQEVTFYGVPSSVPDTAAVPMNWTVFAQWLAVAGEEGKFFEQRIQLTSGKGEVLLEASGEFELTKPIHRMITNIRGFPIRAAGSYRLALTLRQKGFPDWEQRAEYPLTIVHAKAAAPVH